MLNILIKHPLQSTATLVIIFTLFSGLNPVFAAPAAAPSFEYNSDSTSSVISDTTGLGNQDPIIAATYAVNWALSILGLLALVLLLYGGFIWMQARGNEESVTKAKGIITAAVIGLIIILSSYGISAYVFTKIGDISTVYLFGTPAYAVEAYTPTDPTFEINSGIIQDGTQLGTQNPVLVASYIINWALTLLGFFFLVLTLYGGFIWMNARGREEEVTKSKELIKAAVIGIIIILVSYGLTTYIFRTAYNITVG